MVQRVWSEFARGVCTAQHYASFTSRCVCWFPCHAEAQELYDAWFNSLMDDDGIGFVAKVGRWGTSRVLALVMHQCFVPRLVPLCVELIVLVVWAAVATDCPHQRVPPCNAAGSAVDCSHPVATVQRMLAPAFLCVLLPRRHM